MRIMLSAFYVLVSIMAHSQELVGTWKWGNDEYESVVSFSWSDYHVTTYLAGTQSKVRETFLHYEVDNDTITFSESETINPTSVTSRYVIRELTDSVMRLENLDIGAIDQYVRVSDEMPEIEQYKFNEFYFDGGGLVCISDREREDYLNCLNFNIFSIDSPLKEVERIFGKPFNIVEHLEKNYRIYVLDDVENTEAYLAINQEQGEIQSMQMTGLYTLEDLSFSSIRLGDYYTMVVQRLGAPSKKERIDEQTELWDYAPFSFSLEMRNDKVYSVKLIRL